MNSLDVNTLETILQEYFKKINYWTSLVKTFSNSNSYYGNFIWTYDGLHRFYGLSGWAVLVAQDLSKMHLFYKSEHDLSSILT